MSLRLLGGCITALCCLPGLAWGATRWWPDFAMPEKSSAGWIAKDMTYNGIPMQIIDLRSSMSAEKLIDFYRKTWAAEAGAATPLQFEKRAGWYWLHKRTAQFHFTVQARDSEAGSTAILTTSRLPEVAEKARSDKTYLRSIIQSRGAGFPKLHGSIVQLDIDADDDEKIARTLVYRNNYDVENNVLYLSEALVNAGWTRTADHRTRAADFGRQLVFQKQNEEITMTVRQTSGTTEVVANHTRTR
jgi:hypothetical protein